MRGRGEAARADPLAAHGGPAARPSRLGLAYAASIFSSAFLLFTIQPAAARLLLPPFGGSPAVWNTALVFFQCLLLAGYAYAHLSVGRLRPRPRRRLHALVLLLPLATLPPALAAAPDPARPPFLSVWLALAAMVGAPFFVLASNSSLIQHWYAITGRGGAGEPYRLYAASNLGSLLALLAYPFLIEPRLGLERQLGAWTLGYGLFAALTLAVMADAARRGAEETAPAAPDPVSAGAASAGTGSHRAEASSSGMAPVPTEAAPAGAADAPTRTRRLIWAAWAAIAVSLLMSTTLQITTDLAAVPLLWILPLLIYLGSFVVAFAWPDALPRRILAGATVLSVALSLVLATAAVDLPVAIGLGTALATLAAGTLLCHADIARDRPSPRFLTGFYLWISIGGALGGLLNSLLAPLVFNSVAEYPITLVLLALVAALPPGTGRAELGAQARQRGTWAAPIAFTLALAWAAWRLSGAAPAEHAQAALFVLLYAMLVGVLLFGLAGRWGKPGLRWAFVAVAALTAVLVLRDSFLGVPVRAQARSFFGVHRVLELEGLRLLRHGTTVHGSQAMDPALRRVPRLYYHRAGPMSALVRRAPEGARIAVVGLGTGSQATDCRPGQRLTYFEIDPVVEALARTHFSYLADAACDTAVVIGDGRLRLAELPDGQFDLLIVDAFSSDAIPIHLLTEEAVALFLAKLRPGGLLAYHISNRHFDLRPVLAGAAAPSGAAGLVALWEPEEEALREGAVASNVVALSRDPAALEALAAASPLWGPLDLEARIRWTDDFASLLPVLRWGHSAIEPEPDASR